MLDDDDDDVDVGGGSYSTERYCGEEPAMGMNCMYVFMCSRIAGVSTKYAFICTHTQNTDRHVYIHICIVEYRIVSV